MNGLDQRLGNYQLTRLLGHGGFADVYLGEHIYLKSLAAIKILRTPLIEEDRAAFLAEARTLISLTHPHIIRMLDFGVEGPLPFLVMDYAPNGTLRQCHRKGELLPLSTVISYATQIADALRYAHQQKIVHRDIKPENMLLGKRNDVLLSDFGIAVVAQSSRYQGPRDIAGTIAYMAPEQIQSYPCPASDQYALGMVVYEWLSGYAPFQGSFTEIAAKQAFALPPPLREKNSSISSSVEQVVMKALEKDPARRFPDVQTFALALDQKYRESQLYTFRFPDISSGETLPSTSIPPSQISPSEGDKSFLEPTLRATPTNATCPNTLPVHISGKTFNASWHEQFSTASVELPATMMATSVARKRRGISRRAFIGGAIGGGVALVEGGIVWHMLSGSNTASGSKTSNAGTTPPVRSARKSSSTPASAAEPTSVRSPKDVAPELVYYGSSKMYTTSWSPDGLRIAAAGEGAMIQILNAATSNVLFSLDTAALRVYRVVWSPDGTRIVCGLEDGSVQIWDIKTKHMFRLTGHTQKVNCVAWSPDSTRVVSGSADKTAIVWNAVTGVSLFSYGGHTSWINGVAWSHNGANIVSGSGDFTAQVWSATDGTPLFSYTNHTNEVLALAWSPDDTHIASASDDGTVQVWDAVTGHLAVAYRHHSDFVVAVDWSLDGAFIASGSRDATVQVWNPYTGIPFQIYGGHRGEVEGVAWSPDSRHIASASDDMTVHIWQISRNILGE